MALNDLEKDTTPDIIGDLIRQCINDKDNTSFYPKSKDNSYKDIKGSEVLNYIFLQYSIPYNKVEHGEMIARYIVVINHLIFQEISDDLEPFITQKKLLKI